MIQKNVNHLPASRTAGISILNDVLGPVMRGPSSSHTAASYRIGQIARALAGAAPASVEVAFDPAGSYGQVFRQQGVDLGFATGLMGLSLTDPGFFHAIETAASRGMDLRFVVRPLHDADHPNTVEILLHGAGGERLEIRGRSIGGGAVEITRVDGWPVLITGETHTLLVEMEASAAEKVRALVAGKAELVTDPQEMQRSGRTLLYAHFRNCPDPEFLSKLRETVEVKRVRTAPATAFVKRGKGLFRSAAAMTALAEARGDSLGRLALAHEASLLDCDEREVIAEMACRIDLMKAAVEAGLGESSPAMRILTPSAGRIFRAEAEGRLAAGGMPARAAARALAVMQVNSGMGVVCAAPTGGSAGVLPAVLVTLMEERALNREGSVLAALAAGAVGIVVAERATFAAEVAGCQVEIGAAGAMAAAAVVEAAGGSPAQAADAAAISFQNTMGSVCDLVQGLVEIPCHTRNAAAAAGAFVNADIILGGYVNPIPLDETVDAVLAVGRAMPSELRVTSRGGLAVTPSALVLKPRK